eukprot:SAG11_NODE_21351_length_427_cov_0.621951_1_plen_82_part_01
MDCYILPNLLCTLSLHIPSLNKPWPTIANVAIATSTRIRRDPERKERRHVHPELQTNNRPSDAREVGRGGWPRDKCTGRIKR